MKQRGRACKGEIGWYGEVGRGEKNGSSCAGYCTIGGNRQRHDFRKQGRIGMETEGMYVGRSS